MASVSEYSELMDKILASVNELPAEDRDVAMDIWRRGGCEALAIWAGVYFQILELTGRAGSNVDDLATQIRSAMIQHRCLKMQAMLAEDCGK